MSPALIVYRLLTRLLEPLAPRLLDARARQGKEDPVRVDERLGLTTVARPAGDPRLEVVNVPLLPGTWDVLNAILRPRPGQYPEHLHSHRATRGYAAGWGEPFAVGAVYP